MKFHRLVFWDLNRKKMWYEEQNISTRIEWSNDDDDAIMHPVAITHPERVQVLTWTHHSEEQVRDVVRYTYYAAIRYKSGQVRFHCPPHLWRNVRWRYVGNTQDQDDITTVEDPVRIPVIVQPRNPDDDDDLKVISLDIDRGILYFQDRADALSYRTIWKFGRTIPVKTAAKYLRYVANEWHYTIMDPDSWLASRTPMEQVD